MRLFLAFFYFYVGLSFHAFAGIQTDLFPDEDFIPFYVEIVQDYETGQGPLRKGSRAVVLRPVDAAHLRVSISRLGTFTIPAAVTNVQEEIARMQSGEDPNLRIVPRMSFFLANRVASGESGWQNIIRNDVIDASTRWCLLYGDASDAATAQAVAAASEFYDALEPAERLRTVFVFMDIEGNKDAIARLAESLKPSIQCMPGYLSRGYAKSLDHIDDEQVFPQLVEVASSGRVIRHLSGVEAVRAWVDEEAE